MPSLSSRGPDLLEWHKNVTHNHGACTLVIVTGAQPAEKGGQNLADSACRNMPDWLLLGLEGDSDGSWISLHGLARLPLLVNLNWRFCPGEGCEQLCSH